MSTTTPGGERRGAALTLLCVAQFVDVLGVGIVVVALPQIRDSLGARPAELQFVMTAYALLFGSLLVLGGRAADLYGRRLLFRAGLAGFALASLVCGLAQSAWLLALGRAAQGAAAAIVVPSALALVTQIFDAPRERARALAVWTAAGATGGAAGFFVGGIVTDLLGWRWLFLLNLPVVAVALPAARRLLPEGRPGGRSRLDVPGAVTVTAGLGLLILAAGLLEQDEPVAAAGCAAAAVAALAAFVLAERRSPAPLVPGDALRRTLVVACGVSAVNTAVISSAGTISTLYVQGEGGLGPFAAGLFLLPLTLAVMVMTWPGERLLDRRGHRVTMAAGLSGMAAGAAVSAAGVLTGSLPLLCAGLIAEGAGLGVSALAATSAGTGDAPAGRQGMAAGLVNTSAQLGTALGIAALLTVAGLVADASGGDQVAGSATAFGAAAVLAAVAVATVLTFLPSRLTSGRAVLSQR